ncbi:MAG: SDR family oxidoreductase [Prevotella sp.]|nr:SDR family oxidoreductase [Prevotella sp.]MBP3843526.1 SDR family oxidoreductase [Prevotella sp.]
MYNPFSLDGKIVLITGSSSGIGKRTALECSKLGAKVILTARNEKKLKEALAELEGDGHQYICADLSNDEDIANLVEQVPELNGLVCNAGINKLAPISHIKESDLESILKVNTISPAMLIKMLLKKKKLLQGSSVVFTASVSGNYTSAIAHASYSISKAGISAYMRVAALELASKKIRCNSVCPGMIDTPFIHKGTLSEEQLKEDQEKNYPLGRYGKPEDIAYGIAYLLSDAASWVTGVALQIDGGFTIK